MLLNWTCLESLARCDRQAFLPHYSQNGSPLRHTTSDGLDRTESVVLWGFPPNHHEEAALVTTAALSVELCYPAVIEERDQRHIGNPLVPAIKLLDRYIQRFIRQKARGQWRILLVFTTAPPTLALLVSLEQDEWQVVEPATKHFNRLRGKNRQAHLAPPSTRIAYGIAFLTELFNLSVAGFEIPEIWKNTSIMTEPLQGSVISPALYNHFVSACLVTDGYMTSYAGDFALLKILSLLKILQKI